MPTNAEDSPNGEPVRPTFLVRLVRFVAWLCLLIGAFALLGLASVYVPCFLGETGACVSGVLLLFGGLFVLAFGGFGLLLLALTRKRVKSA